jgi:hypothetical protein
LPGETEENYEHLRIIGVPAEFLTEPLKSKNIPLRDRVGPYGCEASRLPHFLDIRLTESGEIK